MLTAPPARASWSGYNLENLIRRTALFGIISIGVAFVIVTAALILHRLGGVPRRLRCPVAPDRALRVAVPAALAAAAVVSVGIGLFHGLQRGSACRRSW